MSQFETVKVAHVSSGPSIADDHYYPIPIKPGKGQIALLLAAQLLCMPDVAGASNYTEMWIWRKSFPQEDARIFGANNILWPTDPDVLDYHGHFDTFNTAVGAANRGSFNYKVYPYPIVLIRQPQMVVNVFSGDTFVVGSFWYMLKSVTDKELTKLMVKDHA